MVAFLIPGVSTALVILVRHIQGINDTSILNSVVPGHPVSNLILGILTYFSVAAVVPLVLLLLARTGQKPSSIGIGVPGGERTYGRASDWRERPGWRNTS